MEGPEMEWTDGIRKSRKEIALVLGSGSQGLKQCKAKRSERQGRKARQAGPGETWKWREWVNGGTEVEVTRPNEWTSKAKETVLDRAR